MATATATATAMAIGRAGVMAIRTTTMAVRRIALRDRTLLRVSVTE
jgi:hypothetical protein